MNIETMFFYHIEVLRIENNVTLEDFITNVCSERQYWRYKNGENLCPQDKFSKFLEKLQISYNEFFNYFYAKELQEYKKLNKLYENILKSKKNMSKQIMDSLKNINFISYETKSFFEMCKTLYNNEFSSYSNSEIISRYSKSINYPCCLNKKYISFREIVILIRIAHFEALIKKYDASEYLYDMIIKETFLLSSNTRYYMPAVYVKLAKIFGSIGNFEKSLSISKLGLKYSNHNYDSKALPNLYFLSALAKYKLGLRDKFESDLVKCVSSCLSAQSAETYTLYCDLIQKSFNINHDTLLNIINSEHVRVSKL